MAIREDNWFFMGFRLCCVYECGVSDVTLNNCFDLVLTLVSTVCSLNWLGVVGRGPDIKGF